LISNYFKLMTYLIFELGDAFDASKTGFRGANTTGWREQHVDPSIDESADDSEEAAMVKELREKRITAQKKR